MPPYKSAVANTTLGRQSKRCVVCRLTNPQWRTQPWEGKASGVWYAALQSRGGEHNPGKAKQKAKHAVCGMPPYKSAVAKTTLGRFGLAQGERGKRALGTQTWEGVGRLLV